MPLFGKMPEIGQLAPDFSLEDQDGKLHSLEYYKGKKFIKIANKDTFLSTNDVIGTNKCIISVCKSKYKDKIIILSAIDNLIKGGSGQAVQNMNLRFGLKENEGIQ